MRINIESYRLNIHINIFYNTSPWMFIFYYTLLIWYFRIDINMIHQDQHDTSGSSTTSLKTLPRKTHWDKNLVKGKRVQCVYSSPHFDIIEYPSIDVDLSSLWVVQKPLSVKILWISLLDCRLIEFDKHILCLPFVGHVSKRTLVQYV